METGGKLLGIPEEYGYKYIWLHIPVTVFTKTCHSQ